MAVTYEVSDRIAKIVLDRPKALNAFDREQYAAFAEVCAKFSDDDDAWVAIITGAGDRAFSAGADLRDMIPALMDEPSKERFELAPSIMRGMYISKPLIAAINGFAFGGGLEVALACDLRIASTNAQMGQPEVGLGLLPGWGGTQRLPRLLGESRAMEIILTGDPLSAERALEIGLVHKVVEADELMDAARSMAERICRNGPLAVRACKSAAVRGMQTSLDEGLRIEQLYFERLAYTDDMKEGVAAFNERRTAEFTGR
jgi:enoyl-CoA hydratase